MQEHSHFSITIFKLEFWNFHGVRVKWKEAVLTTGNERPLFTHHYRNCLLTGFLPANLTPISSLLSLLQPDTHLGNLNLILSREDLVCWKHFSDLPYFRIRAKSLTWLKGVTIHSVIQTIWSKGRPCSKFSTETEANQNCLQKTEIYDHHPPRPCIVLAPVSFLESKPPSCWLYILAMLTFLRGHERILMLFHTTEPRHVLNLLPGIPLAIFNQVASTHHPNLSLNNSQKWGFPWSPPPTHS